MNEKSICSIIVALMIPLMATMILSVNAWSYGDPAKPDDLLYEKWGPRCDRLLIKLYTSQIAEWDTGLETGQIDATDWPLDATHYDRYATPPWNDTIKVISYGADFGIFLFDLNNNNNQYLGNPPDPAYPNPVYPNPMSDVDLRKAVAYLSNRPKYITHAGSAHAVAIYTPLSPAHGKYVHPDIKPGGAREDLCYLYSREDANATMDAGGFPTNPVTGWRYWDMNSNHVEDIGEAIDLKIIARMDDPNRDFAGSDLSAELNACGVHTTLLHMLGSAARTQVTSNKDFHIYTGGWSLSEDPDFLIWWNWDFYWHPWGCYNHCGCNDPDFNYASYGVLYANDQASAVASAHAAQIAFATQVLGVPLWASTGPMAVKRAYTGTPGVPDVEDIYEGDYWEGFVNIPGYGVDNGWSFLSMHPEGHDFGNGTGPDGTNMTIRYGFKTQEIKTFNPIYAEWLWDNAVIDLIGYESLLVRDPYNLGQLTDWTTMDFEVSTYPHPAYGTCTKVVFTVRPDIEWSDGMPVTLADIFFTFVEMKQILDDRGLPPPWWYSNVMNILSFRILDAYNFEVLLDVKSVFAAGWIGGNRIMPKHIWKPICESGDPTTFAPDPNLINSGPWRLEEYVENSHVLLTANSPEKTVDNNLLGSGPIMSDLGYYRHLLIDVDLEVKVGENEEGNKIPPNEFLNVNLTITLSARIATKDVEVTADAELKYQNGETEASGHFTGTLHFSEKVQMSLEGTLSPERKEIRLSLSFHFSPEGEIWNWSEPLWITIPEDIAGSTWYDDVGLTTYPYKSELVTPDIKVDVKDLARASGAFGSYPGHLKWSTIADITGDYKIDIKDLAKVSAKFGWHP